ncbi:MAG: O-methyltransferase [Candidatus Cyclobacteriaceae bacterium M3_2C_046]
MNTRWILTWLILTIGINFSCQSQSVNQMNETEKYQFRMKFIEDFDRIGLNTTPGDANLLRILVESSQAQRGVEIGSATGYGAIVMGMGFEATGGKLITIDIDPSMVQKCQENVQKMGLNKTVEVKQGDALKVIPDLEGNIDFVFIDAMKSDYYKYFKAIQPKLAGDAIIVADNVIRFQSAMQDFLSAMAENPDYLMQIIMASEEKGDGMAIIYKRK